MKGTEYNILLPGKRAATCHPSKPHYGLGLCRPCYIRKNSHRFPSRSIERQREKKSTPRYKAKRRDSDLKRKFGIGHEDYTALLKRQGGCCAICKAKKPGGRWSHFAVDHDHLNGNVRGLLCVRCNRGVGLFRDDATLFKSAAIYLGRRK